VGVSVSVWVAWGPAWGQTKNQPRPPQQPSTSKGTDTQYLQRGAKDSPIFVHIEGIDGQASAPHTQNATSGKDFYDKLVAWSAASAALFTLALVVIGWGGVRAAFRTLKAIEAQAQLMREQVTLMQAPFHQGLEFTNWNVNPIPQADPVEKLRIRADLGNPTGLPITILEGKIIFGNPFAPPDLAPQIVLNIKPGSLVTPKTPYSVDVTVGLSADDATDYTNGRFEIGVRGEFFRIGPLGDRFKLKQSFLGYLSCGRWGAEFSCFSQNMIRQAEKDKPPN